MKEGGFTLVEVIVSLAIISISLVTLLSAFNRSIAAAAGNTELTGAVMLANEKMIAAQDEAITADGPAPGRDFWKTDARYPGFDFKTAVTATPFDKVNMVKVAVRYNGKETFSLASYVVKQ